MTDRTWMVMRAVDGVVHWAAPRDGGWDTRCGLAPEWMARDHTISCAACDRLAGTGAR